MQKSKDSFFAALRDRLSVVNHERTVMIDGQLRPGILVCENEAVGLDQKLSDVFCVTWGASAKVSPAASSPVAIDCTISFKTAGAVEQNGMTRGRELAAMTHELSRMLEPRSTTKMDFANGQAVELNVPVFWSQADGGPVEEDGRFVSRSVTLKVFCYTEVQ
jgi:hypothetical protein